MRPRLARRPLTEPHPSRLPAGTPQRERIVELHRRAVEARQMSYVDPVTGLYVFTALAHASRGYCCDSGCRHCPYV